MYVANAGDSRAITCKGNSYSPMSMDFTPENERDRIRRLAQEQPTLLGKYERGGQLKRNKKIGIPNPDTQFFPKFVLTIGE